MRCVVLQVLQIIPPFGIPFISIIVGRYYKIDMIKEGKLKEMDFFNVLFIQIGRKVHFWCYDDQYLYQDNCRQRT